MADPLLSPSTITAWLECDWYLTAKLGGVPVEQNHPNPFSQLLMEKGLAHETACLAEFEARGLSILRTPERDADETFAQWVARVGHPFEENWDVIYQFPLVHDGLRGVADFLVRVPEPVEGHCSYEPYDAKLARLAAKPGHVLQLCFYADALEALTGWPPRQMHLWLGSGQIESLEVEQFGAYWRRLRRRLTTVMAGPVDGTVRPEKCAHCEFCEYSQHCQDTWRGADSLVYVANIRKKEMDAFEEADIATVVELAATVEPTPGVSVTRQVRLRKQAELQVTSREEPEAPPAYWPIPPDEDDPVWGHGYGYLPEPDPGDVYFDLEGHPFWTARSGLFFLFGLWYQRDGAWTFEARWAHDLEAQSRTAAGLVAFFDQRRQEHPDYHVYHFNHTERSQMEAMTLGHPSEALFTHLKDTGLFVDLMAVAGNSFQVGVESYGLKSLEVLPGYQRHGGIEQGSGAVVDYDRYMASGNPDLLEAIARYNEDDVRATHALHGWLLGQRPPDAVWREPVLTQHGLDPDLDLLVEQLLTSDPGSPEHLLGDLLGYWRREDSATVGPKFAKLEGETHLLLEDPDVVAGLSFVEILYQGKKGDLAYAKFSWPEQVLSDDLRAGDSVLIAGGPGEGAFASLSDIDREGHTLLLRWTDERIEAGYLPRAVTPTDLVSAKPKPAALAELARQMLKMPDAGTPGPVCTALIERALPRFLPGAGPDGGIFHDDLASILSWAGQLDSSFVAIQGPPGTGKTYRGAHIIHALVTSGKRVGISAFSHAAVDNLLAAVHSVFEDRDELHLLSACKKVSNKSQEGFLAGVTYPTGNPAAANAKYNVVAGTSWLFASPQIRDAPVDVLVIDEAGQLALADAVAASGAAHNVILLGDPLQLAQVSKAVHPDGAGASVLEHILGDVATMASDRGVFLSETRRMHPAVCEFVSAQFYEGRLSSHEGCAAQDIDGVEPGLVWIEAQHRDRSTESPEEAALVAEAILGLLGRRWTNAKGERSPLTPADFMVVAPYNDQVHLVRDVLEADPRTAGVEVGTVDKFQGREAPVVFFTMATSTGEDMPRGPDFLFSRNRLNVAISRAQYLAGLICNDHLLDSRARTVEDMRLIGTLSAFVESARPMIHLAAQDGHGP
jgi:predicted RecB family nuclease